MRRSSRIDHWQAIGTQSQDVERNGDGDSEDSGGEHKRPKSLAGTISVLLIGKPSVSLGQYSTDIC